MLCDESAILWDAFAECSCQAGAGCETICETMCNAEGYSDPCFQCAFPDCSPQLLACTDDIDPACLDNGTCVLGLEDCSCPDCMTTAFCVPDQCVDDGMCNYDDACTCVDCESDMFCADSTCNLDGECQSFYESCACADCSDEVNCQG